MQDQKVKKLAEEFVREWNQYLAINPILLLDYTWPSLGVLDFITFAFRFRDQQEPQVAKILKGASAYLAVVAHSCFKSSVAKVRMEDLNGISILLEGGEFIPEGEKVLIPVENILKSNLRELPRPFPVTRKFKTEITFESPVISMLAVGICTGLSPGVEGYWSDKSEKYLASVIENSCKELAIQSANYYARLFPDEPLGQMAEFYLNKLIYPPLMMNEELPLIGAIPSVLEYFESYKISSSAALKLGENLAQSPDHALSNLGLILCCALSKEIPNSKVLASANRKGSYIAFLRRSVQLVRKFYGEDLDWIEVGLKSEDMYRQITVERSMKFLPWLYLSVKRIKEDLNQKVLAPLLISISDYNIPGSIEFADKILEFVPDDVELIVQRIRLELMRGADLDKALVEKLIKDLLSSPKADDSPEYFSLLGNLALSKNEPEKALSYFKAALSLRLDDLIFISDLQNNAAWSCMLMGQYGQALEYLEKALSNSNCPITILLNKASVLSKLGDMEGALKIRKKLFAIAPCDRRVFASLTLEEIVKTHYKH